MVETYWLFATFGAGLVVGATAGLAVMNRAINNAIGSGLNW